MGGLSEPSKMPGYAYGLPAKECKTGATLRGLPGSVCSSCYAFRGELIPLLIEGCTPKGAAAELHEREGWCWPGDFGIHIIDWEMPDLSAVGIECEEVERREEEDE